MENKKEEEAYKELQRLVREEIKEAGFDVSLADMNFLDKDYKNAQKLIEMNLVTKHYEILDKLDKDYKEEEKDD